MEAVACNKKYNACYSTSQRQYYYVLCTKKAFTTLVFKLYKPMLHNMCNLLQWIQAHAIAATGTHIHSTVPPSQLTDHVGDPHTSPPIQYLPHTQHNNTRPSHDTIIVEHTTSIPNAIVIIATPSNMQAM